MFWYEYDCCTEVTAKDKRPQIFVYILDNQRPSYPVHFYIRHLYGDIKKIKVDKDVYVNNIKLLHFSLQLYFGFRKAACPSKNLIMFLFDFLFVLLLQQKIESHCVERGFHRGPYPWWWPHPWCQQHMRGRKESGFTSRGPPPLGGHIWKKTIKVVDRLFEAVHIAAKRQSGVFHCGLEGPDGYEDWAELNGYADCAGCARCVRKDDSAAFFVI